MTASNKTFNVGFRNFTVFGLNATNSPAASGISLYEGFQHVGAKALNMTFPAPREIVHVGDDRVEALDFLPPNTALVGEVHVGLDDLDLIALLSGVKVKTAALGAYVGLATDQQGSEPFVGILAFQQGLDYPLGPRNWHYYMFPYTKAIYMGPSMTENVPDIIYKLAPQIVSHHLWETAFDLTTEGFTTTPLISGHTTGKPAIASWLGDGNTKTFSFDAAKPARATTTILCWVSGVLTVPDTLAVGSIAFTNAPASNARIVVFYEY